MGRGRLETASSVFTVYLDKIMRILMKTVFWAHLVAGLAAGLVIFIMAATGVLMTYERQIIELTDGVKLSPAPGAEKQGVEALLRDHLSANPAPTAITISSDPEKPALLQFGRAKSLFVDPYTAESLGEGNKTVRGFFKWVVGLHRWLAMEGTSRDLGKSIVAAANLVFLFLIVSGLWLWCPRRWWRSRPCRRRTRTPS